MGNRLIAWALVAVVVLVGSASLRAADEAVVVPLKVDMGGIGDRDSRCWAVPVTVNGERADFAWGCGGFTIISEAFAHRAKLAVRPDDETTGYVDPGGQPLFAGQAEATFTLAGQTFKVYAKVMKDAYIGGRTGALGYDVAKHYQWQVNPDRRRPTMTLRAPGRAPTSRPIAVLPMRDDGENLWLAVKIRNVAVDVCLMPQSTDLQVAPEQQARWDLAWGKVEEIQSYMGPVQSTFLEGKDTVELARDVVETDLLLLLIGDPKHPEKTPAARSGIGASLLNRYVYVVDPQLKQFMILARVPKPTTRPAAPGAGDKVTR